MSDRDWMQINKGSDKNFSLVWPDGSGPLNLTGYGIEVYDAAAEIAPFVTVSITGAAAGEISGRIAWDESIPMNKLLGFRVRIIAPSGDRDSTSLIQVRYQ